MHGTEPSGLRARAAAAALAIMLASAMALARQPSATPTSTSSAAVRAGAPSDAPREPRAAAPRALEAAGGSAVHVLPPASPAERGAPVVLLLHGMCMDPLATCGAFSAASEQGFLVCPAGNARCDGAADWRGTPAEKAAAVDATLDAFSTAYGAALGADGDRVIVGYSRGAFVARDVLYERPGRFRGAIFLGAAVAPDADRLRASGVRRVVFASGDYDGARSAMQRAAARLDASGLPAAFVGLGPIAHGLPPDLGSFVRAWLAWVLAG